MQFNGIPVTPFFKDYEYSAGYKVSVCLALPTGSTSGISTVSITLHLHIYIHTHIYVDKTMIEKSVFFIVTQSKIGFLIGFTE